MLEYVAKGRICRAIRGYAESKIQRDLNNWYSLGLANRRCLGNNRMSQDQVGISGNSRMIDSRSWQKSACSLNLRLNSLATETSLGQIAVSVHVLVTFFNFHIYVLWSHIRS